MDRRLPVWEQELYCEMVYNSRHSWFHSFEAEKEMVGICFADDFEATNFLSAVRSRLNKMQNREKRRSTRHEPRPLGQGSQAPVSRLLPGVSSKSHVHMDIQF